MGRGSPDPSITQEARVSPQAFGTFPEAPCPVRNLFTFMLHQVRGRDTLSRPAQATGIEL